ncbi:hypothetical protein UFOVP48_21 [uncultured Caudovirales phage]|uniref:Uncharacterized protein n=1 Tax=uncultured Caudovirales phage TaxID=2100421 RepID=A0A6J5KR78_9CAUD|nr:hypothetical protein UFOVP48_21 [uncultured Caudovirales phage]
MRFLLSVDGKDMVLDDHQLDTVMAILNSCEELKQQYKGDGKGSRGSSNQYTDELHPVDPRGGFTVKPLDEEYYETLKLVAKLAKA